VPLRVQRQAKPQIATAQVRAAIPARMQGQSQQMMVKTDAAGNIADRQRQVIQTF
jgi:hypothetical protein